MQMKNRLIATSRTTAAGSPDGDKCAYNGVRELFCAAGLPPKVKARKAASSHEAPYIDALGSDLLGNNDSLPVSTLKASSLWIGEALSSDGSSKTLGNNGSFDHGHTTMHTHKAGSASIGSQMITRRQQKVPEEHTSVSALEVQTVRPTPTKSGEPQPTSGVEVTDFDDIGVSSPL